MQMPRKAQVEGAFEGFLTETAPLSALLSFLPGMLHPRNTASLRSWHWGLHTGGSRAETTTLCLSPGKTLRVHGPQQQLPKGPPGLLHTCHAVLGIGPPIPALGTR